MKNNSLFSKAWLCLCLFFACLCSGCAVFRNEGTVETTEKEYQLIVTMNASNDPGVLYRTLTSHHVRFMNLEPIKVFPINSSLETLALTCWLKNGQSVNQLITEMNAAGMMVGQLKKIN